MALAVLPSQEDNEGLLQTAPPPRLSPVAPPFAVAASYVSVNLYDRLLGYLTALFQLHKFREWLIMWTGQGGHDLCKLFAGETGEPQPARCSNR